MADAAQAEPELKDGEVRIDVDALNGSDEAAAGALAGLFDDNQNLPDGESQSAETGDQETGPTGDTEDGHSEQGESSAIEPPVSWSADAKEVFSKLPPELQQIVAKRESERESLLATHGQKATEAAKLAEAERTAIANERAQQVQFFNAIALQLTPELQRFQNVDWNKLATEQPAEWAKQSQAYQDTRNRFEAAMQAAANLSQQSQAEQAKKQQEVATIERAKLIEKIPELADPLKGKAYFENMLKHVTEFTPADWSTVYDHRYYLVARDAMLWRQSQAAKAAAQTKRVPAAQSNVRTLRPAARQEGGASEVAEQKELAALQTKLAKSGSTRDAQSILERVLG